MGLRIIIAEKPSVAKHIAEMVISLRVLLANFCGFLMLKNMIKRWGNGRWTILTR
ncbi:MULTISPECIES: hypothetical protein [unclassified Lysinibacillus]|uniref:hypothetical protein n=1 Tax=unclassified Lysinibacillus TaxID=2636778 RepID=UPI0009C4877C|nr:MULTISPECIES: hypothetical protein [unclassified Lysinibacillus]SKB46673.1 hypothetical protein SAMN06295926_102632 [Lysinibacillus sp. AC-3]